MRGFVDPYHSRRTSFVKCYFWNQKQVVSKYGSIDYSVLAHDTEPTGFFYAEQTNDVTEAGRDMPGSIRGTARTVSILTNDDVMGQIFRDDLVRFEGRIWRVESIALQKEWKRSQFLRVNRDGTKIITLRS